VAAIADAAETGKPAARDTLLAMEAVGTATRIRAAGPASRTHGLSPSPRPTAPARKTSSPGSASPTLARRPQRDAAGHSHPDDYEATVTTSRRHADTEVLLPY
jgi:hypothetical protein